MFFFIIFFFTTQVQVLPNVVGINVYWISKEPQLDDSVSKVLQENAPLLRHELSQLRVLGHVPRITFVKGKISWHKFFY